MTGDAPSVRSRDDRDRPALHALFERARAAVPLDALPSLVMNDPGTADYVHAYARVLRGGAPALSERDREGALRLTSFAVTENLYLSHACAARSETHRWFSLLAGCVELLGAGAARDVSFAASLATVLVDGFALREVYGRDGVVPLVAALCDEERGHRVDPRERALATVGALLCATPSAEALDDACRALTDLHEHTRRWYLDDGTENPCFSRGEGLLGAVAPGRAERRAWAGLIERWFPTSTEAARATRERLLDPNG